MLEDARLIEEDEERKANRTWGTELTAGGSTYATSLFWQPLQNKEDPFTEVGEASEGVLEGADLFCIKGGKAPQFGICVSQDGYKTGQSAAAVALSTSLSNIASFVAVFKVDNGWWYTCIRNDIILSDGDMLFLKEEDAKNQFLSMLAVPDWGRKIAPKEWGLEETESPDLGALLSKGAKAKLQKIKGLRGTKLIIVISISGIVGFWLLSNIITGIFLAPPKKPIIVPVQPKIIQQIEKAPEIKPWEKVSKPSEVLSECYSKIKSVIGIMPPGWELGNLTCSVSGVSTSWKRNVGRLTWIKKSLDQSRVVFSGRSFSDDGNTLVVTVPLAKIKQISSPPVKSEVELRNTINDLFQTIGQPVTLSASSFTSEEKNVYKMINFKFTSIHNPLVWSDLLVKFSGLNITYINYTPTSESWEYEGAIYAL